MTPAAAVAAPVRERLETLLDYMAQGAYPPGFCADCLKAAAARCDECAQLAEDFAVLNAALGRIQQAEDDTAALAVYMKTVMSMTGIFPGSAAALRGGGAR